MNDYEIKKLYEDMELYLIKSMKRNLGRHLNEEDKVGFKFTQWQAEKLKELKRYQRENEKIIGEYTSGLDEEISKHLKDELKQGSINAIRQYNKVMGKSLKPNKVMNKSFFKTNDRKVNALIKVVNNDLKTANTGALRMINDQYRQIIHRSAFFVGNGVMTEKQAVDEASKNFLAAGLNCIEYSDGRRVNIASYSQMAIRTASLRAHLMGEGDFRKSIGRTLVQATSHGGACPICKKWEKHIFIDDVYSGGTKDDGPYMLLSTAMEQGFLHPNCRHGLTTYYPELEEDDEEVEEPISQEQEETQEQLNYAIRNVRKYRRLEKGSLDYSNIIKYIVKREEWTNQAKQLDNQLKKTPIVDELLTSEEKQALTNYTGFDATNINRALRKDNITPAIREKIKILDSAFTKAQPLKEDMIVYRGTLHNNFTIFADKGKNITNEEMLSLKEHIITDKAFSSTSRVQAESLGRNVIMKIKLPKGYTGALDIEPYAIEKYKYQKEILLNRNCNFFVKDVIIKDNKYFLDVEVV